MSSLIPLSSFFTDDELLFIEEEPFSTWKREYIDAAHAQNVTSDYLPVSVFNPVAVSNHVQDSNTVDNSNPVANHVPRKRPRKEITAEYNRSEEAKETGEYIPEFVVRTNATKKLNGLLQKKGLRVRIRWAGYTAKYDTWESYYTMKHNTVFHQYCRRNDLEYLIPVH